MIATSIAAGALADVPSSALTARLYEIRRQERALLVEFLEYLSEVDRRKVHVDAGYPTLFAFLVGYLGYSNSAAFRRSQAARLLARFPAIAPYLDDGRLNLTTLVLLRDVLDEATHLATLERAASKTEEQVKELVAALRPRPAPADLLRRLPSAAVPSVEPVPAGSAPLVVAPLAPPTPPARPAARVEPISEDLRVLRVTVGREFVADLHAVRALLSHQIPDGNLERVLHECLRRARRELERRREGATERPARNTREAPATADGRAVPAAVRREVFQRDGRRCTFVGADGHVCGSTHQLQLHHLQPFARGGPTTVENMALRCSVHNARHAEVDFGRDRIARARAAANDSRQLGLL